MRIRSVLMLVVGTATALLTAAENRRPNIVLIFADDLGWKDVGYNGSDFFETPPHIEMTNWLASIHRALCAHPAIDLRAHLREPTGVVRIGRRGSATPPDRATDRKAPRWDDLTRDPYQMTDVIAQHPTSPSN